MGTEESIAVNVQLRRPSDGCVSEPITFYYTQTNSNKFNAESIFSLQHSQESYRLKEFTENGDEFVSESAFSNHEQHLAYSTNAWRNNFVADSNMTQVKSEFDDNRDTCHFELSLEPNAHFCPLSIKESNHQPGHLAFGSTTN